jgi:hypothetical protein
MGNFYASTKILVFIVIASTVAEYVAAGKSGDIFRDMFLKYLSVIKNAACNGEKLSGKLITQMMDDCQFPRSDSSKLEDIGCHLPCLFRKFGWIGDDYEGLDSLEKIIKAEKRAGTGVNPEKIQKPFAKELLKRNCHKKWPPNVVLKTAHEDKRDCKKMFSAVACYLAVASKVCQY